MTLSKFIYHIWQWSVCVGSRNSANKQVCVCPQGKLRALVDLESLELGSRRRKLAGVA